MIAGSLPAQHNTYIENADKYWERWKPKTRIEYILKENVEIILIDKNNYQVMVFKLHIPYEAKIYLNFQSD